MDTTPPDLIGTAEAAKILGVTPRQVLRIVEHCHKLPGKTGAALYDRATVEALADTRRKERAA